MRVFGAWGVGSGRVIVEAGYFLGPRKPALSFEAQEAAIVTDARA